MRRVWGESGGSLPSEEKALLQTLAVIGKEFPLSLLTRVVEQPEDQLHRLLAHLQGAEFVYEQPAFPEVEYTFKHALTQEVAYNSLLLERRKGLHERIAQAIEALFGDRLEDHYSELAHHYSRSGNTERAVAYLQRAGQQALQRSAHGEAIAQLTTALELLNTLPDTVERTQQELLLQTTLGPALMAAKGYAAPEVEQAYTLARELCQHVGQTPQLFPVLWGLWAFYLVRRQGQTARELGEQLLTLAQRQQDQALLLIAYQSLGVTLYYLGELPPARAHLERGIALYDPQQHRSLAFRYGGDPGVHCRIWAARALWSLGYPDQALQRSHEALTLAWELAHPLSLAAALYWAGSLHQSRWETRAAQERAEAAMTLSSEQGFPFWLAAATMLRSWTLAERGQGAEGIARMHQGLAALRATGAGIAQPYYLGLLAEAYGKGGQTEEGLRVLAEALAAAHTSGERYYEAGLYRLKGELLLAQEGKRQRAKGKSEEVTEAEECFRKAIEIAQHQSAKSLELRAVMSLSRLWQQQGKKEEARHMLAEIYGWFTEGFDTADLKEAKALLRELTH
ncbi:MAG: hypothetical protein HYZ81_03845 [Nitrospinae bacterium]|nr:hypothetical protein [Nitrospinota bacterium]